MLTRIEFLLCFAQGSKKDEKKREKPPPNRPGRRGAVVSSIELPIEIRWNREERRPDYLLRGPLPALPKLAEDGEVELTLRAVDVSVPKQYRFQMELLDTVKYKAITRDFLVEGQRLVAIVDAAELRGRGQFELRIAGATEVISRSAGEASEFKNAQRSEAFVWNAAGMR
jgi:hypothetical protein